MKPSLLDRAWSWAAALPLATLITLIGLSFFSSLAAHYESFYSPLSINLDDIGLNYAAILARSGEQIITGSFFIVLLYLMHRQMREASKEVEWRTGRVYTGRWRGLYASRAWLKGAGWLIIAAIVILAAVWYLAQLLTVGERIEASVAAVREGRAVERIESKGGVTLLNVHVREARIDPITQADVPPAVRALAGRPLLYVGQADGTLVLFDPKVDRAIYFAS